MSLGDELDDNLSDIVHRLVILERQQGYDLLERLSHLEQVVTTFFSESTKQWTEERLRALELQVRELRGGKRTKADSGSNVTDVVQGYSVPSDIDSDFKENLRQAGLFDSESRPGFDSGGDSSDQDPVL